MDQPDHMNRLLPYRYFSLCYPIFKKNEISSRKFVKLNKIQLYTNWNADKVGIQSRGPVRRWP